MPAAALATLAAVAGCGGAAHPTRAAAPRTPCASGSVAALARGAGQPASAIASTAFTANSGAPGCRFAVRRGPAIAITATLDSSPQPYQRLERQAVEYGQGVIWFHEGAGAYPQTIENLGLDADWLPVPRQLITTDGVRLITVTVAAAPRGSAERLAGDLARTYLGRPRNPF